MIARRASGCFGGDQFIGAGLNLVQGYLTGECFAFAEVVGRRFHPEHRCEAR